MSKENLTEAGFESEASNLTFQRFHSEQTKQKQKHFECILFVSKCWLSDVVCSNYYMCLYVLSETNIQIRVRGLNSSNVEL